METETGGYTRTLEDVRETLELAVIKESSLTNVTQALYSTGGHGPDQYIKLLELDEHLLEAISRGDRLSFRGNKDDPAVLCTKDRTYDVKEAETSNSCILVPHFKFSKETNRGDSDERVVERLNITGVFQTYYEVRECKPKLEKLLRILEPSSFKGKEYESTIDKGTLFTWDTLQSEVQASETELGQALNDYLIVNIDGYYRIISFEYEARSLTYMLDLFDENGWEIDEVNKELTYEPLKELILEPIFEVLFKKYAEPSEKTDENGTPLYRYNKEKCCKILAKVLLAASPVTDYKQFMESWTIGTPDKMEPREEYLSGVALVVQNSSTLKKEVISFPEADLPKNVNERFNELFKAKDKWTVDEITPYVSSLASSKMNVNALLTKHARCSLVNGTKYYSSKHGK